MPLQGWGLVVYICSKLKEGRGAASMSLADIKYSAELVHHTGEKIP